MSNFRNMRRFKQQTTDEECTDILKNAKRGILAVLGDEGYPYTVPLDYVYEDGHIYFHCAKEGHKLDAVRGCDKASFCVLSDGELEPDDWWYHFTSVVCFGRVHIVEEENLTADKLRALGRKYFPNEAMIEDDMAKNAARALVLDFEIEHMMGKKVKER